MHTHVRTSRCCAYLAGAARVRESQGARAAMGRVSFVQTVEGRALFQFSALTLLKLVRHKN
jgi:hypothetical protein